MGLIILGPSIIPPPPGVDVTNSEKWFIGLDLVFAYFPMAWIGVTLAGRIMNGSDGGAPTTVGDA